MTSRILLLTVILLTTMSTTAQERSFSFGVGPALTYALTSRSDHPAKGYSTRFSFTKTSKAGMVKGVSVDLTEVSTIEHTKFQLDREIYGIHLRKNYGHPAVAIAANLGREITKGNSSFSYYGSLGPVFAFQSNGGVGAMAGAAAKYFYQLDKNIAIGLELSPRFYYLRMFHPPAGYDLGAAFVTVPATFNFRFMLSTDNKKQTEKTEEMQPD